MAETLRVSVGVGGPSARRVTLVRVAIIAAILAGWEALAASGLLFRDVVPSLTAIGAAVARLLANPDFYGNLGITAAEIGVASHFLQAAAVGLGGIDVE